MENQLTIMDYLNKNTGYLKAPARRHMPNDAKGKSHILNKNTTMNEFCTEEQKVLLEDNMSCIHYRKGEVIFHEGQPSFLIYFIFSGVVKLWKEGLHKPGQIIRFAKEGDMMGFWGSLENKNYTLTATALTDAHVYCIKKDLFFPIVQSNTALNVLLHDYIKELKKTEDYLRNMAEMNVREKVANALLIISDVFKDRMDEEAYKVILFRRDIAALSAICEDRVSKQLSEFKNEGIIVTNEKDTFIDFKALQKIVEPYLDPDTIQ